MHSIQVSTIISADRERTFDALSDHERFLSGKGLSCRLARAGKAEPNGLGACRSVDAGSMIFDEDIVSFERPVSYEYRITRLAGSLGRLIPLVHEFGKLTLSEVEGGTRVDWITRYRINIPLLGWVVERLFGIGLRRSFGRLLARADHKLQSQPEGAEIPIA